MNKTILLIKSLLHKANFSCGRPLVSLMFGLFVLSCSSSTEETNPMEYYYMESLGLAQTTLDSTKTFAHKYNKYVFKTPGALNDNYYKPTMSNLYAAFESFGFKLVGWDSDNTITIEENWGGEDKIDIEF
jgi:hypothetical protein